MLLLLLLPTHTLLLLLALPMAPPPKLQFISRSAPRWWMAVPDATPDSLVVVEPSRPLPTKTESWTTTAEVKAGPPLLGVAGPSTHSAPPSAC